MYSSRQFPICVECHMKRINKEIEDPKFKKLLGIPDKIYRQSVFLRNIKESYLRFQNLTEKQIEAFKKTVKDLKEGNKKDDASDSE